ncbi:DUF6912 family protein [Sciscionella marina]|uniref:DUF6912 family protein n=1 Tax=Sciscionella marina TaxID=508770 RepID=UPI00037B6DE4|nr:hypothetical protein [Sciscionella marina]
MRIYLPATIPMLRELVDKTELTAVGGTAFALTPALRESYTSGNTEELEYAALLEAARAALRLLSAEEETPRRRAVIAADVEDATPRADLDLAAVRLAGPVALSTVAAVHVDDAEAEGDVTKAAEVIDAADLGDGDAEFAVGSTEGHELSWYAPQELPFFLELFEHGPS